MSLGVRLVLALGALAALAGCNPGTPLFPADYRATYTEVRNCRQSGDHDLHMVRVLASPDALVPYTGRATPFPVGAIVLKEEYDFGDITCSGSIVKFTVIQKLAAGSRPSTLDWTWQSLDGSRGVLTNDDATCIHCHSRCGVPPDGYDGTCEVP